jgi:hypothetical protein
MSRQITRKTTVESLKREAKRWLKAIRANVADARARFARAYPRGPAEPTLRDVLRALAREYELPGWLALKARLAPDAPMRRYDKVADALVTAFRTPDDQALEIVWDFFGHRRTWDAMRRYVRLDLGRREEPESGEADVITLDEARYLVARSQGFETWAALEAFAASVPRGRVLAEKAVGIYASDSESKTIGLRSRDWDQAIAVMRDRQWPGVHASGQMTDGLLERISRLEHVTTLDLEASRQLTDEGVRHLARLPRLTHLNLSGTAVTDAGLDVLHRLPALETISLAWTGISDAGARHLAACDRLRSVDLSGTAAGDGAIRALAGKAALTDFRSGNGVTNAGIRLLHDLPVFKTWHGGDERMALLSPDARPNFLLLRGPFTDDGFVQLAGLDGLFALNVDSRELAITGAGLAPLVSLPHLTMLAFDAHDDSMPYIAALPHLRFLLCQDTDAGDDGFEALGRSRSIEYIWGRRCYNLRRRGFLALARMPALRHLSVSCKNVDAQGLAALPQFPALTELMPMDVPDEGYRHIGRCAQLESLVLMYCRNTTDAATEHIAGLRRLQKYFASYNRITDRTPEILSTIDTLEEITFDTCAALTNVGIARLARLPKLRDLSVGGMPRVTSDVARYFGAQVHLRHNL